MLVQCSDSALFSQMLRSVSSKAMSSLVALPLTLLLPPFLLFASLPLAILAGVTSALAFTALLIRVGIVYLELGAALIRSYLSPLPRPAPASAPKSPDRFSQSTWDLSLHDQRRMRRRGSGSWSASLDPPLSSGSKMYFAPNRSDSFASLLGAGAQGPSRDYEGIGGWRDHDNDPESEKLWLSINRRLELPAVIPPVRRHHHRSHTGSSHASLNASNNLLASVSGELKRANTVTGSGVVSPEMLRMSPVQSRARTPSATDVRAMMDSQEENYFGLQIPANGKTGEVLVLKSSGNRRKSVDEDARMKCRKSSVDSISSLMKHRGDV